MALQRRVSDGKLLRFSFDDPRGPGQLFNECCCSSSSESEVSIMSLSSLSSVSSVSTVSSSSSTTSSSSSSESSESIGNTSSSSTSSSSSSYECCIYPECYDDTSNVCSNLTLWEMTGLTKGYCKAYIRIYTTETPPYTKTVFVEVFEDQALTQDIAYGLKDSINSAPVIVTIDEQGYSGVNGSCSWNGQLTEGTARLDCEGAERSFKSLPQVSTKEEEHKYLTPNKIVEVARKRRCGGCRKRKMKFKKLLEEQRKNELNKG